MRKAIAEKPHIRLKTIIWFIAIMVIGAAVSSTACCLFYYHVKQIGISRTRMQLAMAVHGTLQFTHRALNMVMSDLEFLAGQNELRAYLKSGAATDAAAMAMEYQLYSAKRNIYDQLRFLDRNGNEMVRINNENGGPVIIPGDQLQAKQHRYYFKDARAASPGAIYISRFDLNSENGVLEQPVKPVIRFSTPVFSDDREFMGVVVLNCLGKHIIDEMLSASDQSIGEFMIVNSDGYWLSSPNREDEWGFIIPERADKRFGLRFPAAWSRISTSDQSQFISENILFTSETFSITHLAGKSVPRRMADNSRFNNLKIINIIPQSTLNGLYRNLKTDLIYLWMVMALLTIAPSWILASNLVRRQLSQDQLWRMATFDTLTGLYNRHSFKRILDQTMDEARRYDRCFAIFFIDLDGFKSINDQMGHDAGDTVLQQAARRMQRCLRSTDRLARLGGDEFCIIILEVNSQKKASQIARKLISELQRPFDLKKGTGRIGASIGISLFPWDGRNGESLVKSADTAMYAAKTEGKGRYRFAI
jgi:diguanylate cyclase (GGDEF)-like protein